LSRMIDFAYTGATASNFNLSGDPSWVETDLYDFEAMVADRIYRPSLGLAKALDEIRGGRGTHFDPQVVDTFLELIATDTVHLPLPTKDQGQKPLPARPEELTQTQTAA